MDATPTKTPHLLIYAHYYHPDVASTGQLLRELAEELLGRFRVTVICVVPSYDGNVSTEYRMRPYYVEQMHGVELIRVRVPPFNKGSKLSRVRNILTYFLRSIWATGKVKDVDYVYSISQPPVLGGLLGVWGKWRCRAPFIYNIQDFNPEQTIATGYSKNKFLLRLMLALDKFSCRQASKVIVVGRDLVETLENRFPSGGVAQVPEHVFINNWTDEKEIYPLPHSHPKVGEFRAKYGLENKFVFLYSGNLGLYYDLENLIRIMGNFPPGTKTADGREVAFAFIGAGSIRDKLEDYQRQQGLSHMVFIPYQEKTELNYSLNSADVHWCVSAKGIRGVSVPSKLYGEIATGKPVLGVMEAGAEARLIMEETRCGLVCEPLDYPAVERAIAWFIQHSDDPELARMGQRGRDYLVQNLTRSISVQKYTEEILTCV